MFHSSSRARLLLARTSATVLAIAFAAVAAAAPNPIPAGSKLVFNFNVLGFPAGETYTGGCGNGHRIFVNREANNAHVLVQNGS